MTDDDDILNREKSVRIMCEYTCEGVWHRQGRECGADRLPVDGSTREMLAGWQAWYEESNRDDSSPLLPWFDRSAHVAFGLFIARRVKHQLPD